MIDSADAHDRQKIVPLDILRAMVGHRLLRVEYKTSSGLLEGAEHGDRGVVQEVDHAVLLSTESMTIALEWCICNYDEFLNIVDTPSEGAAAAVTDIVDVTGLRQWSALMGSVVVGFGMATQRSEEGRILPWAIRISVESGASVVVGLGELQEEEDTPNYQPDNLVVIFDQETARSYQIVGSSESAWGRDLKL